MLSSISLVRYGRVGVGQLPSRLRTTRTMSSLVLRETDSEGIVTLKLKEPPVNALTRPLLTEITQSLHEVGLKADPTESSSVKGLVLTSNLNHQFSAGLDLRELHRPNPSDLTDYLRLFIKTLRVLTALPLPTAAVYNGHALAGGAVFGLACERRFLYRGQPSKAPKGTSYWVGLNEVAIGISIPPFLRELSHFVVNYPEEFDVYLDQGTIFQPDDALKVGLVEEIHEDLPKSLMEAKKWCLTESNSTPWKERTKAKLEARARLLKTLDDIDTQVNHLQGSVLKEDFQKMLDKRFKKA
ncbi:dodecenoyl-CoA isomerase [Basidiobolus ranarum]|uniref:Dodecenoyl-CoA isomerase n=1 Tax=Basidiobolus ranarum TaxID=34480 RepID=A0ABR2X1D6_9FUNG